MQNTLSNIFKIIYLFSLIIFLIIYLYPGSIIGYIFYGDIRILLSSFKYGTVDRLYVLFPDPWVKKRHKSRRLLSPTTIEFFYKILKPKGAICIATDVEDYQSEIEEAFSNLYQFKKLHVSPKEKDLRFFLDVRTKYEKKAINKGLSPSYLVYKKV